MLLQALSIMESIVNAVEFSVVMVPVDMDLSQTWRWSQARTIDWIPAPWTVGVFPLGGVD